MRADDHDRTLDSNLDAPARGRAGPRAAARGFERLVRAGRARRLSPRRLLVGALLIGAAGWAGCTATQIGLRRLVAWVGAQPEHQLRFDAIALTPPPSFIRRGTEGILNRVRQAGQYPATISVLSLDTDQLRRDLARSPWVETVGPVRRSYRSLAVSLVYRQPTALMVYPTADPKIEHCALVDRRGVELPSEDGPFDWQERGPTFIPRGGQPLCLIRGFGPCELYREGQPWLPRNTALRGDLVHQAIALADFLAEHRAGERAGSLSVPGFRQIWLDARTRRFWLDDPGSPDEYEIDWGAGPGSEAPDEPKAAEKWAMLGRFVAARGSLRLKGGEILVFEHPGIRIVAKPPTRRPGAPGSDRVWR